MSEWQPIETVPKTGKYFLVYSKDTGSIRKAIWSSLMGSLCDVDTENFNWNMDQLLWKELPKPPVKEHNCKTTGSRVIRDEVGNLILILGDKREFVRFCPYCGESK